MEILDIALDSFFYYFFPLCFPHWRNPRGDLRRSECKAEEGELKTAISGRAPDPTAIYSSSSSSSCHFSPPFHTSISLCNLLLSSSFDPTKASGQSVTSAACSDRAALEMFFFFFTYLVLPNFPVSLVPIWLLVGLTRPLESFKFSSLTHELSFSSGLDFVIVTCYLSWRVLPRR